MGIKKPVLDYLANHYTPENSIKTACPWEKLFFPLENRKRALPMAEILAMAKRYGHGKIYFPKFLNQIYETNYSFLICPSRPYTF